MAPSIDTLKKQLQELKALLAQGALSEQAYKDAAGPLERALVDAVLQAQAPNAAGASAGAVPRPSWRLVSSVVAFVLIAGVGGYWYLGHPQGWDVGPGTANASADAANAGSTSGDAQHEMSAGQIAELTEHLAKRLQSDPNDVQGWSMLAHSYAVLGRYPDAVTAYKHLLTLQAGDAQLWADYADASGMAQNRTLSGAPATMIAKSLSLDPDNFKALALSGSLAYEQKDYARAAEQWAHAMKVAPPNSELSQQLQAGLDDARKRAGLPASLSSASARAETPSNPSSASSATVSGEVRLSPALQAQAAPEDTVFIFARPTTGSRMPLAIVRKQVKDLPYTFELSDSMAMSPQSNLSSVRDVIIGARVSKAGNAMPVPGDLQGESAPVAVGAKNVKVEISQEIEQ